MLMPAEGDKTDYLFVASGVIIFFIGIVAYFIFHVPEIFAAILTSLGIMFSIEHLLWNKLFNKIMNRTSDKIIEKTTNKINNQIEDTFSIIEDAKNIGLISILPQKKINNESVNNEDFKKIVEKSILDSSEEILIMGITLHDLFTRIEDFPSLLDKVIAQNVAQKKNVHVRILLLNPYGNTAKLKALLEGGIESHVIARSAKIEKTFKNIISQLDVLNGKFDNFQPVKCPYCNFLRTKYVEYKNYDFLPPFKIILTDEFLFIQEYNLAPKPMSDHIRCITDGLAYFQYSDNSQMYKLVKDQFNLLWRFEEPITIEKISKEKTLLPKK
jgi:hypothetical protein